RPAGRLPGRARPAHHRGRHLGPRRGVRRALLDHPRLRSPRRGAPRAARGAGGGPRAGRVIEEQVRLVDLAPTLLELAGVPRPSDIQGQSFAGLLRGRRGSYVEQPIVSADLIGGESVRTRQQKFISTAKGPLLYDLVADPGETANRAAADAAGVAAA